MTDTGADSAKSKLRDPASLWPWLRAFTIFFIAMKATSAIVYGAFALRGAAYAPSSVEDLPITLGLLGLAFLAPLSYLLCVVMTLRVQYRAMKNLHVIQSPEVEMGPIFSVICYFIPILNLGAPVAAVGQIWRGTFVAVAPERADPRGLLAFWWAAFVLAGLVGAIGGGVMRGGHQVSDVINGAPFVAASALMSVLAAILFWRVFGAIVKGQTQLVQITEF